MAASEEDVDISDLFQKHLENFGIFTANPTIVFRDTYCGQNVLGKNSRPNAEGEDPNRPGFVPVEWWVCSVCHAENSIMKENEGLTMVQLLNESGEQETLICLKTLFEKFPEILGPNCDSKTQWPLVKVLDIGGEKIKADFESESEHPPIPVHVHRGNFKNGQRTGPGKTEAYFFPPTPDFCANIENIDVDNCFTRLGIKPEISESTFMECINNFGVNDSAYGCLNKFSVKENTGWTIWEGVVHSPGPKLTIEIQRPQDDFNLLSWHLGKKLETFKQTQFFQNFCCKGCANTEQVFEEMIDYPLSCSPVFEQKWFRNPTLIEENSFGSIKRIFFDLFYSEWLTLNTGQVYVKNLEENKKPFIGLIWKGKIEINEKIVLDASSSLTMTNASPKEFFVPIGPKSLIIKNLHDENSIIYFFYPLLT